jgi:hypothetical protein
MAAQLYSLIGVEVLFMVEPRNQVLSRLEFIWIFENSFQNSKKVILALE